MPQQRGQRGHHKQQGQSLECEAVGVLGIGHSKGRVAAADITEDERGAGLRRARQHIDHDVERVERVTRRRDFQQKQRKPELQGERDRDQTERQSRAPVLGQRPGDRDKDTEPECALKLEPRHEWESLGRTASIGQNEARRAATQNTPHPLEV